MGESDLRVSVLIQLQLPYISDTKHHLFWGYTDGFVMQPVYQTHKNTIKFKGEKNNLVRRLNKKHGLITFILLTYYLFDWLKKTLIIGPGDTEYIAIVIPPA